METFVAVRTMIAGTLTAAVFVFGVATSATLQAKPDFGEPTEYGAGWFAN